MQPNQTPEEKFDKLEALGLAPEDETFLGRVIETFTRQKSRQVVMLFAASQILYLFIMILFTSNLTKESFSFDSVKEIKSEQSRRRFSFNLSGLHFFHEFLVLDLAFYNDGKTKEPFNVTSYSISNMYYGQRLDSRIDIPIKSTTLQFKESEQTSPHIRIFSSKLVHYTDLETTVIFKTNPPLLNLEGEFIWSYSDPAFSVVLVFLRFLFFLLSLIIFFKLLFSKFDIKHSHASIRFAFYLIIAISITSDPLYILTYFAESLLFKIIDTIFSLCMLYLSLFAAYFSVMVDKLKHTDVHVAWITVYVFPFLVGLGIFILNSFYANFVTVNDPFAFNISVIYTLSGFELLCLVILSILLGIRIYQFKSEALNEKFVASLMAVCLYITTFIVEIVTIINKIANKGIYLMLPAIIYALFFIFANWPVDTTGNDPNVIHENSEENQVPGESLASQLE